MWSNQRSYQNVSRSNSSSSSSSPAAGCFNSNYQYYNSSSESHRNFCTIMFSNYRSENAVPSAESCHPVQELCSKLNNSMNLNSGDRSNMNVRTAAIRSAFNSCDESVPRRCSKDSHLDNFKQNQNGRFRNSVNCVNTTKKAFYSSVNDNDRCQDSPPSKRNGNRSSDVDAWDEFRCNGKSSDLDAMDMFAIHCRKKRQLTSMAQTDNFDFIIGQTRHTLRHLRPLGKKQFCRFCKNNQERSEIYSTHLVKDRLGHVTCPILGKYVCPLCGATGRKAHTVKYCPLNEFETTKAAIDGLLQGSDSDYNLIG